MIRRDRVRERILQHVARQERAYAEYLASLRPGASPMKDVRTCGTCGQVKPAQAFDPMRPAVCRSCRRARPGLKLPGLTARDRREETR